MGCKKYTQSGYFLSAEVMIHIYKGEKIMYGPKVYAELSSVARDFLAREVKIERPKFIPPYEYLSAGANLAPVIEKPSEIHKFLSFAATDKKVSEEFGKNIDILG